jgi:D-alanyl-D-alanine carboxypeptidase
MFFRLILSVIVTLCTVTLVRAQDESLADAGTTIREKVEAFLVARQKKHGFPGVCVAWVRDGKNFAVAIGVSDVEKKTKMTTNDRMLSGSIGKTYVATLALQLVMEKKLSLDAKVSKYIGDETWFSRLPNAADLTVRSLMNHTSGIRRYVFNRKFLAVVAEKPDHVWKPAELLSHVFDTEAEFPVGKGWSYADTNYIVLGVVLEKITGTTYYKAMQKRVLDKFGLGDTVPSDSRRIPKLIPGYTRMGRMFGIKDKTTKDGVFVINPQFEWCGGGLACTTADLAKWAGIYGSAKLWPTALLKQVRDGVPAPQLGRGKAYGLGVILGGTKDAPWVGHSGFMPGYVSEMRFYAKTGLAIAIQFNSDRRAELGMSTGGYLDAILGLMPSPEASGPAKGKPGSAIRKQGL